MDSAGHKHGAVVLSLTLTIGLSVLSVTFKNKTGTNLIGKCITDSLHTTQKAIKKKKKHN